MSRSLSLEVLYFGSLGQEAGTGRERVVTSAQTPGALYEEVRRRHALAMEPEALRVAVNHELAGWSARLEDGDEVAFLPPFAGG